MKLEPEHTWWHEPGCGSLIASSERPTTCRCQAETPWLDFGWRVGQHSGNYAYYSTFENALKDRRCK